MWVNQLDFITNLGIFLLWLLLALSMVSTVSMVVTTIGRVVSNLVESGLVAFIGCWKDSGSDTLILVTRTCQPLLSLSMIKGCHSRLGDSHSVTDHWQDEFKKQFCHVSCFFWTSAAAPRWLLLRLPECSAARLVTELQVGEREGRGFEAAFSFPPTERDWRLPLLLIAAHVGPRWLHH